MAVVCLALCSASVHAALTSLFWSGNDTTEGGAGTWDTINPHFGSLATGPFGTVWVNANSDSPIFESTAGTVTVSSITLNGSLTDNSGYTFTASTLTLGPSSALSVAAGKTTTMSSILGGAGGVLTKNGPGILLLNANNTYTGGTILNAGTIQFGTATTITLGGTISKLTINADGVTVGSTAGTTSRSPSQQVDQKGDLIISMNGTANMQFTLVNGPWTLFGSKKITVNPVSTGIFILGSTTSTFVQESGGSFSLTKDGTGPMTMQAENQMTGGFILKAGAVRLNGTGIVNPFGTSASTLTFSGGTLTTTADRPVSTLPIINPISVTADSFVTTTSTGASLNFSSSSVSANAGTTLTFRSDAASGTWSPRFSGGFTYAGKIAINNNNGSGTATTTLNSFNTLGNDQTFSDVISGTGSYGRSATAAGNGGNTFMNASHTYSGGTTLTDGGIGLGVDSVGIPPSITSGPIGTGTLTVSPSAGRLPTLFASGGGHIVGNAINLANNTAPLTVNGANGLTLSGLITGTGSLTKSGTGELRLSPTGGNNTYSGGTTNNGGNIAFDSSSSGPADAPTAGPAGTGPISAGNGSSFSALSNPRTVGNHIVFTGTSSKLTGGQDLTLSGNVDLGGSTVTLSVDNTGLTTLSGALSNGGLTKDLGGTLTLSGASGYAGATTVMAGTLALGANNALPIGTTVNLSGGTLNMSTFNSTVSALQFSGIGKAQGTWGSLSSTANHKDAQFAGTGILNVTTGGSSTTSVGSSLNPSASGNVVTFTATVTGSGGGGATPTGTVTFLDNGNPIGSGLLGGAGSTATATFSTSALSVGTHSITASYGGDPTYDLSSSSVLMQTVNPSSTSQGPEYFFAQPVLPPPDSVYISPAQWHVLFAQGIVIRDVRHRFFTQNYPLPPLGTSQTEFFSSEVDFDLSTDNGATFQPASGMAFVTVQVTHTQDVGSTMFFDTEMLQLDLSSGGILLRESPTLQSTGQTTVRPVAGGYMISSFFDVFTELSVDNGNSWQPAQQAGHVEMHPDPKQVTPVGEPTTLLPPPNGAYVSPQQWHALYAQGIVIKDVSHRLFTGALQPPAPGVTNTENFNSQVDLQVSTDGGNTYQSVRVAAPVQVTVASHGSSADTIYDTEMTMLNLSLPNGVMIRESPTEPSRGQTEIEAQADGTYRVTSFFDIFTELSLDGGGSWSPATNGPVRVQLTTPAPEVAKPTQNLPPPDGSYVSPSQWHALYANGIIITNASHDRFTQTQPPPPPGGSQTESFGSRVSGLISTDGGASFTPFQAPADVSVQVNSRSDLDTGNTRFFDTQMLSLSVSNGTLPGAIRVRQSPPTTPSLGRTSVRSAGTGYQISSFFDVFTEVSTDGGQTWWPSVTAPGTMGLSTNSPGVAVNITCPSNITVMATGPAGAVVFYTVTASGGCTPPTVSANPPSGSTFPVGTTTVTATANDTCGNSATCSFTVTVLPQLIITCPSNITVTATGPGGATVFYAVNASGGCSPPPFVTANPPSGSTFPAGTTTVTATASDTCGNSVTCSFTVTVTTQVTISCPSNITVSAAGPSGAVVFYTVTATGGCSPPTIVANPPSGSTFPVGTTTVTATASDTCGNGATCSFTVTVYPQLTIACPSNITTAATGPGGATVFFAVNASGGCSPPPFVTANPPSGSTFLIGTTTVFSTASDTCGHSTNCSFTVTVYPQLTISCPSNITTAVTGPSGATVFFTVNASGGCSPPPFVTANPPSGSTFPVGTTTVFSTASDTCGHSTNCSFTVTVYPQLTISCPSNITTAVTGPSGATVFFTVNASGGCSPPPFVTANPPSGSTFPIGTTTVFSTASDTCGNSATCSFTVTVLPQSTPITVNCSSNITVRATGPSGAVVFYTSSATGGCSPPPFLSCSPPSGSTFPIGTTIVTCTASDTCGQTSTCSFVITVIPPCVSIVCPPSITVTSVGPAVLTFTVNGGDLCGGTPAVVCNPPSGSVFPIGTTLVTCTASDANGSATCSFTVTVVPKKRFFPNPLLSPPDGRYISAKQWHALYANGIIVSNVIHRSFLQSFPPPPPGPGQTHSFSSKVDFKLAMGANQPFQQMTADADCTVQITYAGTNGNEQIYQTEMVALNLHGGTLPPGVLLRESPTLTSTGETRINPTAGGYMISSFFDVFTELSSDGGQTWSPSGTPGHMELHIDPGIPPTLLVQTYIQSNYVTFSMVTRLGLRYAIQTKTNLNGPAWLSLTTLDGSGQTATVTDTLTNGVPQRFYRAWVDEDDCEDGAIDQVTPKVEGMDSYVAPTGTPVHFSVSVQAHNCGTPTYLWDFGDGTNSTDQNPIHAYTTPGQYTVTITASCTQCPAASMRGSITVTVTGGQSTAYDFGDAPAPYPTLLAQNGARHLIVPGFFLGGGVDGEPDGLPNATATGDDVNGSADEDGVLFTSPLIVGHSATVQVTASAPGKLDAWIDFNGNGSWADPGDQVFASFPLAAGANNLSFSVPASAVPSPGTFARFRFSSAGGLSFTGAAPDGEVEDYQVGIQGEVDLDLFIEAPDAVATGGSLVSFLSITNNGPMVATGVVLTEPLPPGTTFLGASPSQGSYSVTGGVLVCSLGSLSAGASATVSVALQANTAGPLTLSVAAAAHEVEDRVIAHDGTTFLHNNNFTSVVEVADSPSIAQQPEGQTVAAGSDVVLSVVGGGTPPLTYQWHHAGLDLTGETASSLSLIGVSANDAGSYTVTVANDVGAILSQAASVAVQQVLTVNAFPSEDGTEGTLSPQGFLPVSPGQSLSFNAFPNAGFMVEYWFVDGNVAQPGGSSFQLPNIQANHSVTVTFNAAAQPTSTVVTDNDKLSVGSNQTAVVTATGLPATPDPAGAFEWVKDFTGIANADKGDVDITPADNANKSTATIKGTKIGRVNVKVRYKALNTPVSEYQTVQVTVVQVAKLQYKLKGAWTDVPGGGFSSICKDSSISFRAVIAPNGAAWPPNQPVWGGEASGTGEEKKVKFATSGAKTVTVDSGGQISVAVGVTNVTAVTIAWTAPDYAYDGAVNGSSTTVDLPFAPIYTACADIENNTWQLLVASLSGQVRIRVLGGGSRDPGASPPTSEAEAKAAVLNMKGYYARGTRGAWHTEAASKRHELHHEKEWKCSSENYWPKTKTALEKLTVPYDSNANAAAAVTALKAGATGADAKMTAFRKKAFDYWFTLPDNASSRPYAAGQASLNGSVTAVQALATAKGWTVEAGTTDASDATPCFKEYLEYNP